jgi:CheY-like chemotaxis protein/HPt (histidine-containing phosphotransfer) domain-containing protein
LNQILDFSRIEAGAFELEATPYRLRPTVDQVIRTLGVAADKKSLELICEVSSDVPEQLIGDPLRLRQILVNLIGNAIKFTARGEVLVRVELASLEAGEVQLRFTVADTGIGISPADQKRIFSPFTQADPSTTRHFGGSGLGLAITCSLVRLMGGSLWLESELGHGSRFHFTVRALLQPAGAGTAPVELQGQQVLHGLRVLLVAENASARHMLEQTLLSWAVRTETAGNAPTALVKIYQAAAANDCFHLVVVDTRLSGIDGWTLADWLYLEPRLTGPVVLMVATAELGRALRHCAELGAVCVEKPVSQSELFDALVRALGLESQLGRAATGRDRPPVLPPPSRPLRVLVAEDTPANQQLMVYLLSRRGHQVELANNGCEAVESAGARPFDVLLMDVQMPVMDGLQATAAIRAQQPAAGRRLPIVAVTAHALKGDAERFLAAGMDGYLSKPIDADELIALVESLADASEPSPILDPARAADSAGGNRYPRTSADDGFNLAEALASVAGQEDLLRRMVDYFFEEADAKLAEMQAGLQQGDGVPIARAAHRLKGTAVYLGAKPLMAALDRLETLARANDLAGAAEALEQLQRERVRLERALALYRSAPPH